MNKQQALEDRARRLQRRGHILDSATVYLSGPMDFVASREEEKNEGWRTRVSKFLQSHGATVYDPWNKPVVAGMRHYGKEDEFTVNRRENWNYASDADGALARDELCQEFWPTLHIDLRMTDLADFVIAYCPTNIYSVGTVHEIATARLQHKPVLLVTPRLEIGIVTEIEEYLASLEDGGLGAELFCRLQAEIPMKPNPEAIPSLWYMAMLESEDYFFDGFGFADYQEEMEWEYYAPLDRREEKFPPRRPLLPYLEKLNHQIPKHFDAIVDGEVENPEWLIFADDDIERGDGK